MSRHPRYVPPGGALVEVTYRTVQGRHLLRPDRALNELLLGALGRALDHCPEVGLVGVVVLSNHLHLLLSVPGQAHLSQLMEHFGGQAAREVNRLRDWSGPLWSRRYTAICVTTEPEAQVARLEYLLSQGVKEHLVARVSDWPGIHCGKALLEGRSLLMGTWVDRTKRYRAQAQGKELAPEEHTTQQRVELVPLPCWRHWSWRRYSEEIRQMVARIEQQAREERQLEGIGVVGAEAILSRHPESRPERSDASPPPPVHAATRAVRKAWKEAFGWFLLQYREASQRLRSGRPDAHFPPGCFPPGLPFVGDAGGMPWRPAVG